MSLAQEDDEEDEAEFDVEAYLKFREEEMRMEEQKQGQRSTAYQKFLAETMAGQEDDDDEDEEVEELGVEEHKLQAPRRNLRRR